MKKVGRNFCRQIQIVGFPRSRTSTLAKIKDIGFNVHKLVDEKTAIYQISGK